MGIRKTPKPKTCIECKSVFLLNRGMGLSKFCSPTCFYENKNKKQVKKQSKMLVDEIKEVTPTIPITNKTKTVKIDFKRKSEGFEKQSPIRDAKYMSFVRENPCIVCGNKRNNHAHHVYSAGLGLKCSDYYTIPLCHGHHTGFSDAIHVLGFIKFIQHHKINIEKIMLDLVLTYFLKVRN